MPAKVSILLPNLNNREYLEARIQSIWDQTLKNWELIIVDSYSNDGAWEYFQSCAQKDKRIKIYQSRERGIYNNFNKCIQYAKGEYIYFATSDDTMCYNALEKMVQALDENPGCDLAHCKLKIIDQHDEVSKDKNWNNFYIVSYFGDLINRKHIRQAPHDGVLHFCGITVYTSLTQLLIRRSLFQQIGLFIPNYGAVADFEWELRATLLSHTVHVPEYLATWRLHSNQATTEFYSNRAKASGRFIKMANHALKVARRIKPAIIEQLDIKELKYLLKREQIYFEITLSRGKLHRWIVLCKWMLINYKLVFEYIDSKRKKKNFISQKYFLAYIKKMVVKHKLKDHLKPI
jgi:glycosyltransferase involved in cell wall biosynthesis